MRYSLSYRDFEAMMRRRLTIDHSTRVMALLLVLVTDLLGVAADEHPTSQMTYDLRDLRLKI